MLVKGRLKIWDHLPATRKERCEENKVEQGESSRQGARGKKKEGWREVISDDLKRIGIGLKQYKLKDGAAKGDVARSGGGAKMSYFILNFNLNLRSLFVVVDVLYNLIV
ncbi:hypothetical protein V6N11_033611 [Hibiscus sabdariffa]|uniref:Uncharacterized protein n=1 Tax=Hibiscus sabdariffa TaxID=183260 RepID=A0ABR2PYJ3_9ROSI